MLSRNLSLLASGMIDSLKTGLKRVGECFNISLHKLVISMKFIFLSPIRLCSASKFFIREIRKVFERIRAAIRHPSALWYRWWIVLIGNRIVGFLFPTFESKFYTFQIAQTRKGQTAVDGNNVGVSESVSSVNLSPIISR